MAVKLLVAQVHKWVRVHPGRPWCLLNVYESFRQSCNGTTNWLVIQNANSANARRSCVGVSRRMRLFPFGRGAGTPMGELSKFQVIYMNFICNCINLNYRALEGAPNSRAYLLSDCLRLLLCVTCNINNGFYLGNCCKPK